jgi:hypothetical protein
MAEPEKPRRYATRDDLMKDLPVHMRHKLDAIRWDNRNHDARPEPDRNALWADARLELYAPGTLASLIAEQARQTQATLSQLRRERSRRRAA